MFSVFSNRPPGSWRFVESGRPHIVYRIFNTRTGRREDFLEIYSDRLRIRRDALAEQFRRLFPISSRSCSGSHETKPAFSRFASRKREEYIQALRQMVFETEDLGVTGLVLTFEMRRGESDEQMREWPEESAWQLAGTNPRQLEAIVHVASKARGPYGERWTLVNMGEKYIWSGRTFRSFWYSPLMLFGPMWSRTASRATPRTSIVIRHVPKPGLSQGKALYFSEYTLGAFLYRRSGMRCIRLDEIRKAAEPVA